MILLCFTKPSSTKQLTSLSIRLICIWDLSTSSLYTFQASTQRFEKLKDLLGLCNIGLGFLLHLLLQKAVLYGL